VARSAGVVDPENASVKSKVTTQKGFRAPKCNLALTSAYLSSA
jgi:hypothetical protein